MVKVAGLEHTVLDSVNSSVGDLNHFVKGDE